MNCKYQDDIPHNHKITDDHEMISLVMIKSYLVLLEKNRNVLSRVMMGKSQKKERRRKDYLNRERGMAGYSSHDLWANVT